MASKPAKKINCTACGQEGHNKKSKDCPNNPNVDHTKLDITRILKKPNKSKEELNHVKECTRSLIQIDADTRRAQLDHGKSYGKTPRSHGLCQEASQGIMMMVFIHEYVSKCVSTDVILLYTIISVFHKKITRYPIHDTV